MVVGDGHHQAEGVVEGAFDLDDLCAIGHRAGQLAGGNFSLRDDDDRPQPGPGGVSRS